MRPPEGPNIGLISSLCVFAKINNLGFIETPYRKVENSKVDLDNSHVTYLTAEIEEGQIIAQGNAPLNDDGTFVRNKVKARLDADFCGSTGRSAAYGRVADADCLNRRIFDSVP